MDSCLRTCQSGSRLTSGLAPRPQAALVRAPTEGQQSSTCGGCAPRCTTDRSKIGYTLTPSHLPLSVGRQVHCHDQVTRDFAIQSQQLLLRSKIHDRPNVSVARAVSVCHCAKCRKYQGPHPQFVAHGSLSEVQLSLAPELRRINSQQHSVLHQLFQFRSHQTPSIQKIWIIWNIYQSCVQ